MAEFAKVRAGAKGLNFENRWRCKAGSWRWLSWKLAGPVITTLLSGCPSRASAFDLSSRRIIAPISGSEKSSSRILMRTAWFSPSTIS